MSGIDEQYDFPSCGCKNFSYWVVRGLSRTLGALNGICLNPKEYVEESGNPMVNCFHDDYLKNNLTLVNRFDGHVYCNACSRVITENEFVIIKNIVLRYFKEEENNERD